MCVRDDIKVPNMVSLYLSDNLDEFALCLNKIMLFDEWKCYLGAYDTNVAREEEGIMVLWEKDCRIVFSTVRVLV